MDKIDSLSIEISASADAAISSIDRLRSAIRPLGGTARDAAGGVSVMTSETEKMDGALEGTSESANTAGKNVKSAGKAMEDAGASARKSTSGIGKFWSALKRVAMMRFLRYIIREIADAFKTGITNLYQWSSAVNGTFAKSMDRIATSTLYLKNSLGAMLAPLINTLAPVIEWIIDRIVEVINWINKLFAALSGSQTYTVAKKVATKWGEAGTAAASSAKKAADDIKRTILGFDEINKLEKQNTSSGSGGSGTSNAGTDYTNMFETRQLDGWMSKLAKFISDFNLQIPATFSALLAGFAAVKLAVSAVAKLSLEWLKSMAGKTIQIAVSLIRKGWETITKWVLKFGEAVVDLFVRIKTTALELWSKFAAAWSALNPVLQVGIAISVTAAALWLAYKLAWALAPEKVLEIKARIATTAVELKNDLITAWNRLTTWYLFVKVRIETMASELRDSLVRAWDGLKAWWLSVLVTVGTSAIALKNQVVMAWNGLTDWFLNVCTKVGTAAIELKNEVVKGWKKLAKWSLKVALSISTTATKLWNDFKKSWNILKDKVVDFGVKIGTDLKGLWNWLKKNWELVALGALGVAIAIATPWGAIAAALSGLWAEVIGSFGGALAFGVVPVITGNTGTPGPGLTYGDRKNFESTQEELKKYARSFQQVLNDANITVDVTTIAVPGDGTVKFRDLIKPNVEDTESKVYVDAQTPWGYWNVSPLRWLGLEGLSTTVTVNAALSNAANATVRKLVGQANGGVYSGGIWSNIPQYAGGTSNAHGSLFLAGEAGPEIVGHVGGRTEVLNKSQLAAAMYSAVHSAMQNVSLDANFYNADSGMDNQNFAEMLSYMQKDNDAMQRQNELLRQQNELLMQINEKEYGVTTTAINKANAYMNRRAGTTVAPVGAY